MTPVFLRPLRDVFPAFALLLALLAGCSRTAVEPGPCVGEACPCVFDTDCPGERLCVDSVCLRRIDLDRCLEQGRQPERCNGFDDDCNGLVDDGLSPRPCARSSAGRTCEGVERCGGRAGWTCDAAEPADERCNGRDDDCDGVVDGPFATGPFVDGIGQYATVAHCGGCGRDCDRLIPEALETACVDGPSGFACRAVRCPDGLVPEGDRCLTRPDPLCRPCQRDADCPGRGSRCLELAEGERACGAPCGGEIGCPLGFRCERGQCEPSSGSCACTEDQAGATRSCRVEPICDGFQTCVRGPVGFAWSDCDISASRETCDGLDNDCDGIPDDPFVDEDGRYVTDEHCGVCNQDCTRRWSAARDKAIGACDPSLPVPACVIAACVVEEVGGVLYEWVDVNGDPIDGCECRRRAGNSTIDPPDLPPRPGEPAVFEDENCDGIDGVIEDAIFVWAGAPPGGDGSLASPVRTVEEGLRRRRSGSRPYVLVAEGRYEETVVLADGDVLHGGYASDFRSRDVLRFPSVVRPRSGPALVATGVRSARVAGLHLLGPDIVAAPAEGTPGQSTVAVLLRASSVELIGCVIEGGRAGAGGRGVSGARGFGRLGSTELDGQSGDPGRRQTGPCPGNAVASGGAGGQNRACGAGGRRGGEARCPVFDIERVPTVGAQAAHRAPTVGGDGEGGYDWSFDRLSGSSCSHATESGFPTQLQDHTGVDGRDGGDGAPGGEGSACTLAFGELAQGDLRTVPGSAGEPGAPGQAGGGGGAGGGTARFFRGPGDCAAHELGGAGGGGGAGGCGGQGGGGGEGGGASVAVRLVGAGSVLRDNRVVLGVGGGGGDGGFGGPGGSGGRGGAGGGPTTWSGGGGGDGGDGGNGGPGGGGGGGCGGAALGVLAIGFDARGMQAENDFIGRERGGAGGSGGGGRGANGGTRAILSAFPCGAGCPAGTGCGTAGLCWPLP